MRSNTLASHCLRLFDGGASPLVPLNRSCDRTFSAERRFCRATGSRIAVDRSICVGRNEWALVTHVGYPRPGIDFTWPAMWSSTASCAR